MSVALGSYCRTTWWLFGSLGQTRHHVPFEVVHLLLGPQLDHLAWVLLAKPIFEAVVILDVAVSVLELIESCLEDFDGTLWGDGLTLQTVCMWGRGGGREGGRERHRVNMTCSRPHRDVLTHILSYLPPSAWYTQASFPVLMQPLISVSMPESTILKSSSRVLGSRACSCVECSFFSCRRCACVQSTRRRLCYLEQKHNQH